MNLFLFLMLVVCGAYCNTTVAGDIGSMIFKSPDLQQKLNNVIRSDALEAELISSITDLTKDGQDFALILSLTVNELELPNDSIPIQVTRLAAARLGDNSSTSTRIISGMWLQNLRWTQIHQLASYDALRPLHNDLEVFSEDTEEYQEMILPSTFALYTYFIMKNGSQERMICTNTIMEDYEKSAPIERSKTLACLYEIMNKVWTGDRNDFARILED